MFVRVKKSGKYQYLQVVHNERVDGRVRQHVVATLGRLDALQETGQIDALVNSCARFLDHSLVLSAQRQGKVQPVSTKRIGPALVFDRLWRELGLPKLFKELLKDRHFTFDVERAIFLTVLHRLFAPGSDRAAEHWRHQYVIDGVDDLQLHHLYRTMAWLGEPLAEDSQADAMPMTPRCVKDLVEEALFEKNRDLFSGLELVFFDTTSIYFEGAGGETIGRRGKSKDHRPDLKQMVVGMVLDGDGRPICCELWPGNISDAKTLVPIVDRLKHRFGIGSICIVADRGMISKKTIEQLQSKTRNVRFILGARLRAVKEIRETVLDDDGSFQTVRGPRSKVKDPAPLQVKEVLIDDRRYIVCHNEEQAASDRQAREAIVASLREKLASGGKQLVGNKGYRKYIKESGTAFSVNEAKLESEVRFDGKWVLQTDTDLLPEQVALTYKNLIMVETLFRSVKSIFDTRPIYHKCDETIRGHVFCSFLAAVLLKELLSRLQQRGWDVEWERLRDDLNALEEVTLNSGGKDFVVRSQMIGSAGKAIQAAGVALGPVVRLQEPIDADS